MASNKGLRMWHDWRNTDFVVMYSNLYIDLDGTLKPRVNPTLGIYRFDGQFFFKGKQK